MPASHEDAIRAEVRRRIQSAESLSYRKIRQIAGGSNSTIGRVIEEETAAPNETPSSLPQRLDGVRAQVPSDRESTLRHQLEQHRARAEQAEVEIATAHATIAGLEKAITALRAGITLPIEDATERLAFATLRVDETYRTLMVEIDAFRSASIGTSHRPTPSVPALLSVDQQRHNRLVAENTKLSQRVEQLIRRLHEAGISVD